MEGKSKMRRELLSIKEQDCEDLGNSQPNHIAKNEKACFGENTKDVARQLFSKELRCVTYGSTQLCHQKPEIEMGLPRKDLEDPIVL